MELFRIKLPIGTKVGDCFLSFDHWVSIYANSEFEAKSKSLHKFAFQLSEQEPYFFFNGVGIKRIRTCINIWDLEVYK